MKVFDDYERPGRSWMAVTGKLMFALIAMAVLLAIVGVCVYELL
ncbi:hypothetical protein [Chelatococcus reniformis]|uniref:Uncharacterized protein n=1 Tax=Chelatococcus reniformis TaxID=1494448 RepID=A0A916XKA3_9HYPH|nr:hypothetical protein [Chelatococcus reniformis]GGC76892.1 hypothetical protein GCM10010994_39020 [Chelatococcus reniformis]